MTTRAIHQEIGQIQAATAYLGQVLELTDFQAEAHGSPHQAAAITLAEKLRRQLRRSYTRLHYLQGCLPTAETLSEAAYNRAITLGLEVEAAEAVRSKTYRENRHLRLAA